MQIPAPTVCGNRYHPERPTMYTLSAAAAAPTALPPFFQNLIAIALALSALYVVIVIVLEAVGSLKGSGKISGKRIGMAILLAGFLAWFALSPASALNQVGDLVGSVFTAVIDLFKSAPAAVAPVVTPTP